MTIQYPSLQFVESPDLAAVVRLDVNATGASVDTRALHDGFSLGMAELLGEPASRGRSWGLRQGMSIPLLVDGTRAAARSVLRTIAREATRDGWLRTQLDAASPVVWFKIHKSAPEPLDFDLIFNDRSTDLWRVSLPLVADAFGMGEAITHSGTVSSDPSAEAAELVLPAIAGEMPAPAAVKLSSTSARLLGPMIARLDAVVPKYNSADWQNVAAAVTDAQYLAGAYRATNPSPAFVNWTNVCTYTPTTTQSGLFETLLRVSGSSSVGAFQLRWVVSSPSAASWITTPPVTVAVEQMIRWVAVGRVPFPLVDAVALGGSSTTVLTLQAKRVEAGGDLRLDGRILMVAAGEGKTMLRMRPDPMTADNPSVLLADAAERLVSMTTNGQVARMPDFSGSWPVLQPGETNRLLILRNVEPSLVSGRNDLLGATTTVEVTYRPRYLWGV